jgi:hypothetical protein
VVWNGAGHSAGADVQGAEPSDKIIQGGGVSTRACIVDQIFIRIGKQKVKDIVAATPWASP